jgi:hypothetical protein
MFPVGYGARNSASPTLDKCSTPVAREADLPYPKELIRRAVREELSENPDFEMRSYLELAFVQLECFLSPEEFKVVHDFKRASALAQELAKSGDPRDIMASGGILSTASRKQVSEFHLRHTGTL